MRTDPRAAFKYKMKIDSAQFDSDAWVWTYNLVDATGLPWGRATLESDLKKL